MKRTWLLGAAALLMLIAACGEDGTDDPVDNANNGVNNGVNNGANNGDAMTYHRDVRPLVERSCNNCHKPGGVAPAAFDFTDPEKVKTFAPLIASVVENRTMPPWQANEDCADYKDDQALTDAEIAMFSNWAETGATLGSPDEFEPMPERPSELGADLLAPQPTIHAKPDVRYEPKAGVSDDFRCFVFDPELETDRFLKGLDTVVDNESVLHHLIIYMVPGDEATLAELAELEAEDERPGYECFGGPRTSDQDLLTAWAPGTPKTSLPEGTGVRMPAGSRLVIQMHYNLTEGGGGDDQSGVDLWYYPENEPPAREGEILLVGNLPFQVEGLQDGGEATECDNVYLTVNGARPPRDEDAIDARGLASAEGIGSNGCVQQDFYYKADPFLIHGAGIHMHLQGTHMEIEIAETADGLGQSTIKEGTEQCLVGTDRWDFNWQRLYWFKEPKMAPADGVLRLTCRYDNSARDEVIGLGEGSGDEMCLAVLYVSEP